MRNLLNVFKKSQQNAPRKRSKLASLMKSYGLKPVRDRLDIDHFTVLYCQNRYEDISRWYVLYKYIHAIIMIAFLCLNTSHLDYFEKDNLKWHLYLNHWSTLVCFVEAGCGIFVVSYFHHHCRTKAMRNAMVLSFSAYDRLIFYMYLNAAAITFSTASCFLFWVFIFDKEYRTFVKILEHGSLSAFMVLKLMIERMPFEIPFVYYPMILLVCYFTDVIILYYTVYQYTISATTKKLYIFKQFNTERPMYFYWFALKSCLILAGLHVLLVAVYVSKRVLLRLLCMKHGRRAGAPRVVSVRSYTPTTRWQNWLSTTEQDIIASPISSSTNPFRRSLDIIGHLETLHRQDFIHPEWRHYSADHPSGFYLLYRFFHMVLFIIIIVFSVLEIDKILYEKRSVKYVILWIFYFGNFFLLVSLLQSLFGFVVIYGAFRRDVALLMYYQKSDKYVTGFQKGYATIHSAATTLAIFSFITSWQLIEDTAGSFKVLDYSYDSSHIINPLAMALDFLVVGHPFKFSYLILTLGLLLLNIVFNYWMYSSKITSRNGSKFIYEYLNWDDPSTVASHVGLLFLQAICIHIILWLIFLCKRYYGVALNRRRVLGYQVNSAEPQITLSKVMDEKSSEYGVYQNYPRVEFFTHVQQAGYSQNPTGGSDERADENSDDSFKRIGSPSSGSGGSIQKKISSTLKYANKGTPNNVGTKVSETSVKTLGGRAKSLSLNLVGSLISVVNSRLDSRKPSKMLVEKEEFLSISTNKHIPGPDTVQASTEDYVQPEESKTLEASVLSGKTYETLSEKAAISSRAATESSMNDLIKTNADPLPGKSSDADELLESRITGEPSVTYHPDSDDSNEEKESS